MKFTASTLPEILKSGNFFNRTYRDFCFFVLSEAKLTPQFSNPRLIESRGAWKNDLIRLENNEPNLSDGLDHFKHASLLVFWLRRMSPLVEMTDNLKNLADAEGMPLTAKEIEFRKLLLPYANEYLAFEFGFQIVKFYELGKAGGSDMAEKIKLPPEYYRTVSHFLKYKTVSPHAINLIYRSLFMI